MSTKIRFTTSDLELLPDVEGTRYELIDGQLHVTEQPRWEHQAVCVEVAVALHAWSDRVGLGEANVAPGVIFSREDAVAPDVVWISRERKAAALGDDGTYYGEILGLDGVWANASTLEGCREELASALEDWIVAGLQLGHELPEVDGIKLSVPQSA